MTRTRSEQVMWLFVIMLLFSTIAHAQDSPSQMGRWRFLLEKEGNKAATDQSLRKELLRRRDEEQKLRFETIAAMKNGPIGADLTQRLAETDRANREWLKSVIEKSGWPGQALVGFDGSDAAWLLAQHADPDPAFQKKALQLLNEAVRRRDARPTHLAYLTDRVLAGEGKKQIYGTQFTTRDGKLQPKPIEDVGNVDRRRAEVGLPPLAEYRKQIEKLYDKSPKQP